MQVKKHRDLSFRQLNTSRQILPNIEPSFTAQTIIVNSPNCNIKYISKGNVNLTTIERQNPRQSRSLLVVPQHSIGKETKSKQFKRNKDRNFSELSKKLKEREVKEEIDLDYKKLYCNSKYELTSTKEQLSSIPNNQKNYKTNNQTKGTSLNSKRNKDGQAQRQKQFFKQEKHSSQRSLSPYLISRTQKIESLRTLNIRKPQRNIISFRKDKYFMSADNIQREAQKSMMQLKLEQLKHEQDNILLGDASIGLVDQCIEKAWKKYQKNEDKVRVKSNYDIESYVSSAVIPMVHNKASQVQPNFFKDKICIKQTSFKPLQYDFQFQEEKQALQNAEYSITLRRKKRNNSKKKISQDDSRINKTQCP